MSLLNPSGSLHCLKGPALTNYPVAQNTTIMAWVYITAPTPTTYRGILGQQNGPLLHIGSGSSGVSAGYGSASQHSLVGRDVPVNKWTHLAMTARFISLTSVAVQGYYNGIPDVSLASTNFTYSGNNPYMVCGNFDTISSFPFSGYIQEARIWTRVMNAGEIYREMLSPVPDPAKLFLWSPFTVDQYIDKSGNNAPWTLYNNNVEITTNQIRGFPGLNLPGRYPP